jgi:hypothetical protein
MPASSIGSKGFQAASRISVSRSAATQLADSYTACRLNGRVEEKPVVLDGEDELAAGSLASDAGGVAAVVLGRR